MRVIKAEMEIRLLFWQRVQDVTHGSWEEVRRAALQVEISREISPYKQSKDVLLNVIVFFFFISNLRL